MINLNCLSNKKITCALTGLIELYFFIHVGGAFYNVEHSLRKEKYFEYEILSSASASSSLSSSTTFSNLTQSQIQDYISNPNSTIKLSPNQSTFLNNQLNNKYVALNEVKNVSASIMKMLASLLIDTLGYWAARSFMHITVLTSLLAIILSSISRSYLVWIGYPIYFGSNTAMMLIHITLLGMFPKHQGKYISAFKVTYVIEPIFYNWYLQATTTQQKWFWVCFLAIQPILWIRTFTMLPKWNIDYDNLKNGIRIGWETRFDNKENFKNDREGALLRSKRSRSDEEGSRGSDPSTFGSDVEKTMITTCTTSSDSDRSGYLMGKNSPSGENYGTSTSKNYLNSALKYLTDIFRSLTFKNTLLTIWVNLEILVGMSIYSQYYSYLTWKLPDNPEDKYAKYKVIEYYMHILNLSYIIMLVSLPIIGFFIDFIAKKYSDWRKCDIMEGQTFSMIILMVLISLNSVIVRNLLAHSKTISDPTTNTYDFEKPWIPILAMILVITWIGHLWTVRNVYIVSNNGPSDQQKLYIVNNFLQGCMHVLAAKILGLLKWDFINGDWDKLFLLLGSVSAINLIVPLVLFCLHFVGRK